MNRIANGVRNYVRAAAPSNGGNVNPFAQVKNILRKYGTDAHVYLPGIGVINGLTAGNYLDSIGTTTATVDNPVGLVVDSGGINAIQATTANKPILRRGAVNLLTYSEQFDNAAWSKGDSSIQTNAINSPIGTLTADILIGSATTAGHYISQNYTTTLAQHTFSIYAKAKEKNFVMLYHVQSNGSIMVSLTNGAITQPAGLGAPVSSSVVSLADGWYRCSITVNATAASNNFRVYIGNSSTQFSYLGDGTSGIYLWGAQLETGSVASTYIPTTTAAASSATGNYHWVHDSTDLLTATFPAGYESATTINASTAGQTTLTAQNIVGAYNIGPSIDTYGRFVFKTITASELAIVQSYCNRLAGV